VAQCSPGADRVHSTSAQWPVTPTPSCSGWYGVDMTSRPVGHSVVSSRCPAEIAGVVDALMGRDVLSGRLVEAGTTGYCRAGLERYGESVSEALCAGPRARRRIGSPSRPLVRGLTRGGDLAGRRDLLCEAKGEAESRWAQTGSVINQWLTFWLCFYGV